MTDTPTTSDLAARVSELEQTVAELQAQLAGKEPIGKLRADKIHVRQILVVGDKASVQLLAAGDQAELAVCGGGGAEHAHSAARVCISRKSDQVPHEELDIPSNRRSDFRKMAQHPDRRPMAEKR